MAHVKRSYIIISALLIALGLCMLIWPRISIALICRLTGAAVLLFGVVRLIGYFSNDLYGLAFQFDLAMGIFSILFGLMLLIFPGLFLTFLPIAVGLFILVDGVLSVQIAVDAKRFGLGSWWLILTSAILCCMLGLIIVLNPFGGAIALAVMVGTTLLICGAENLCVAICAVKLFKKSR